MSKESVSPIQSGRSAEWSTEMLIKDDSSKLQCVISRKQFEAVLKALKGDGLLADQNIDTSKPVGIRLYMNSNKSQKPKSCFSTIYDTIFCNFSDKPNKGKEVKNDEVGGMKKCFGTIRKKCFSINSHPKSSKKKFKLADTVGYELIEHKSPRKKKIEIKRVSTPKKQSSIRNKGEIRSRRDVTKSVSFHEDAEEPEKDSMKKYSAAKEKHPNSKDSTKSGRELEEVIAQNSVNLYGVHPFSKMPDCIYIPLNDLTVGPIGPLKVSKVTSKSVILKWTSPKNDGPVNINNYIIEKNKLSKQKWELLGTVAYSEGKLEVVVSDLSPGQSYLFRITGCTSLGATEPILTAKPVVTLKSNKKKNKYQENNKLKSSSRISQVSSTNVLKVVQTSTSKVLLKWEKASKPVNKYYVAKQDLARKQWETVGAVPGSMKKPQILVSGLTIGSKYCFKVDTKGVLPPLVTAEPFILINPCSCSKSNNGKDGDVSCKCTQKTGFSWTKKRCICGRYQSGKKAAKEENKVPHSDNNNDLFSTYAVMIARDDLENTEKKIKRNHKNKESHTWKSSQAPSAARENSQNKVQNPIVQQYELSFTTTENINIQEFVVNDLNDNNKPSDNEIPEQYCYLDKSAIINSSILLEHITFIDQQHSVNINEKQEIDRFTETNEAYVQTITTDIHHFPTDQCFTDISENNCPSQTDYKLENKLNTIEISKNNVCDVINQFFTIYKSKQERKSYEKNNIKIEEISEDSEKSSKIYTDSKENNFNSLQISNDNMSNLEISEELKKTISNDENIVLEDCLERLRESLTYALNDELEQVNAEPQA